MSCVCALFINLFSPHYVLFVFFPTSQELCTLSRSHPSLWHPLECRGYSFQQNESLIWKGPKGYVLHSMGLLLQRRRRLRNETFFFWSFFVLYRLSNLTRLSPILQPPLQCIPLRFQGRQLHDEVPRLWQAVHHHCAGSEGHNQTADERRRRLYLRSDSRL